MAASIKICSMSALQYWLEVRRRNACLERPLCELLEDPLVTHGTCTRVNALAPAVPTDSEVERLLAGPLRGLDAPLHVLVPSQGLRRSSRLRISHVWRGPLPRGAFVKAADGVHVSSPAFCFLQIAGALPLPELIQLGDELCGAYTPSELSVAGLDPCPPLTDVETIAQFLAGAQGARGTRNAQRALGYLVGRSASPMETALEMLLCLPVHLGGQGVPKPEMNRCIDMTRAAQSRWDGDLCMGDLVWPDKRLVVDYNGQEAHCSFEQRRRDDLRRNRLNSLGYTVIDAYRKHLTDPEQTEMLVRQVMRKLGRRIDQRGRTPDWRRCAYLLRRQLTTPAPLALERVCRPA